MRNKIINSISVAFVALVALALIYSCENSISVDDHSSKLNENIITLTKSESDSLSQERPIPGQYIVIFKEQWQNIRTDQKAEEVRNFTDNFLAEVNIPKDSVIARFEYALRGFTARMKKDKAENLQNNPAVDYVEQDFLFKAINSVSLITPPAITTYFNQVTPWGIPRVGGPLDGSFKTAWILDTGIDLDHQDLNVDTNNSASFIAEESADDLNGHGTQVAGLLAAKNNTIDIVGVAANAIVVSVKVLDKNGEGSPTSVSSGVDHVVANGSTSDVINMSLGGPISSTIDDAVLNAANMGFRVSIAAGNEKQDANNVSPARVEHANVWTVSAFKEDDSFAVSFDCNTISGLIFPDQPILR
ncbi:MAG: S8 family serine peptidase [Balneolaceae bacterium]|nr:S8 family serine peptidase [Balneolaceae bacterium]